MSKKPSVLIVTERFFPEMFIINELAQTLQERGLNTIVLTQQPSYPTGRMYKGYKNKLLAFEEWNGVRIIRIKTVLGYKTSLLMKLLNYVWFAAFATFVGILLPRGIQNVFSFQTGPLTQTIPAIFIAKIRRAKTVIWTQDVWPDTVYAYGFKKTEALRILLEAFVKWVYSSIDTILVNSEAFEKILSRYSKKRPIFAPSWPLVEYRCDTEFPSNKKPLFLFAGNLGKVQNLENLVHGFAIAKRRNPDIGDLRIVGDGSARDRIIEIITRENIAVQLPGKKTMDDMKQEYRDARFLVLSLDSSEIFQRTLPAKFSMYLSIGKPILCVAKGITAELIQQYGIGMTADPDDIEDIADGFTRMRTLATEEFPKLAANSMRLLNEKFNKRLIIQNIYAILHEE